MDEYAAFTAQSPIDSGARRTVSWERAWLGAETIEKLECLKNWIRVGVFEPDIVED